MKKRILIVEDEDLIARSLSYSLRRDGYDVAVAPDGASALALARAQLPDVILLDLVLPGELSGYDVCRQLRAETTAPIVMVSARGTETERVLGLERGADDYVTKPFSTSELLARIRAQLRRVEIDRGAAAAVRRVGDVIVDLARRIVTVEGRPVRLTPSEFTILDVLSEHAESVVARDELMSRLWQSDFTGDARACEAHVRRLRTKIEADPRRPQRIVTVRGAGYKLVA